MKNLVTRNRWIVPKNIEKTARVGEVRGNWKGNEGDIGVFLQNIYGQALLGNEQYRYSVKSFKEFNEKFEKEVENARSAINGRSPLQAQRICKMGKLSKI